MTFSKNKRICSKKRQVLIFYSVLNEYRTHDNCLGLYAFKKCHVRSPLFARIETLSVGTQRLTTSTSECRLYPRPICSRTPSLYTKIYV